MIRGTETHLLPAAWVNALMSNDNHGLTEGEREMVQTFRKSNPHLYDVCREIGAVSFGRHHGALCELLQYVFEVRP